MHDHLRRSVFLPQPRQKGCWIEAGIGPEVVNTEYGSPTNSAAQLGAEVFFIDAGWYAKPYSKWSDTVGDWKFDKKRFPKGEPFLDLVHERNVGVYGWMRKELAQKQDL